MSESIFISTIILLLGMSIGSFLNVVTMRTPKKQSIVKTRSHCPHCQHILEAWELIPVFSFIILNEHCSKCRKPISWQYPLVEFVTGVIFLLGCMVFGLSINLLFFCIYSSFLIAIFIYDYTKYLIPDFLSIPAIVISFVGSIIIKINWSNFFSLQDFSELFSNLGLGILIGGGFFLLQFVLSKGRWIGGGDIRLGVVMGMMLGFPVIIAALGLAYIVGAFWGIVLIILKRKTLKNSILPFGTFLSASTIICLLWGEKIVNAYLKFIGF